MGAAENFSLQIARSVFGLALFDFAGVRALFGFSEAGFWTFSEEGQCPASTRWGSTTWGSLLWPSPSCGCPCLCGLPMLIGGKSFFN